MINYSFEKRLEIFRNIVDKLNFSDFFIQPQNYQDLKILEFTPNTYILVLCECMANEKKNYTITHSQDYVNRNSTEKIKDAFSGICAEMCVNILLSKVSMIKDEYIKEFDLERKSWEYPKNSDEKEYDIRLISHFDKNRYINIEVKSSAFWVDLRTMYNSYHLYGGHINNINELTDIADYYFQVMIYKTSKDILVTKSNIENGSVKIYLVGAISARDLYSKGFVGYHSTRNDKKSDDDRMVEFINSNKDTIMNAMSEYKLKELIKANSKILKNPLYIQINLNQTENVNDICRALRYDFLGLNSGILSKMILKNLK